MKAGFRVTQVANFDNNESAQAYLVLSMGLSVWMKQRGFQLSSLKATPEGVKTTYDFTLEGAPKLDRNTVTMLAGAAILENRMLRDTPERVDAPKGFYVTIEFFTGTTDKTEGLLLRLGHMDLLNTLRGAGMTPIHANGTDADKIVLTLGVNFDEPIEYTPEMHKAVATALLNGANDSETKALLSEIANTREEKKHPGTSYPMMVFQNAKFGYVLGNNTFRLGSKWFDALKIGDIVEARDGKDKLLGFLRVSTLAKDNLVCALKRDALQNHGVREMGIDNEDEAAEYLLHILQEVYQQELPAEAIVTVVGFEAQLASVPGYVQHIPNARR